jgi:hypothetical protein
MHCSPRSFAAISSARPVDSPVSAAVTAEKVDRWYLPALSELTGIPMAQLGCVDYLQQRGRSRHASLRSRPHSWNGDLPAGALLHLGDDIYLCSPEFVFLQLSGLYGVIELSNVAMAMSGGYMPAHAENGLAGHDPVTSVAELRSFALAVSAHWGVDKSVQATRWAVDNSRSPMETSLALLIHMPRLLGGYGLIRPVLNRRIYLSQESAAIYPHRYCEADVSAPGSSLLLEYLGRAFHKEEHHDIRRELALQREGYQIQHVTVRQLVDPAQRNEIMRRYAQSAGIALKPPTDLIIRRRISLLKAVLPEREQVLDDGSVAWPHPSWAIPTGWC